MPTSASAAERKVVIVELDVPALSGARGLEAESRSLAIHTASRRLEARVLQSVPGAQVQWRYRRVLAGFAVSVPRGRADDLARLPGVAAVYPSFGYGPLLGQTPAAIGAPALWGPGLSGSAGRGVKIGIIDDGVDQTHVYFDPAAFTMPPGFPKGKTRYTTAKVIVARSFPSPSAPSRGAAKPFDPEVSSHGTHVAGIAAGNTDTLAPGTDGSQDVVLSGVAPLAHIGNYRVLTVPTDSGLGPNGNSPEIVAAIEAAVEDGMDVLNLSIGEPEVPPELDVVAKALDNAAAAGVIPVVAAGNEFQQLGVGSVHSPGNSERAITVAASRAPRAVVAPFSSGGPTPIGLTMKPDVTAPGVGVLSSIPGSSGPFTTISGTSMAAPHVAGAVALLRERHPDWSVAQVKSALVTAARPVYTGAGQTREVPSTRQGGGFIDLPAADAVRIFAEPQGLAFGLVDVSAGAQEVERTVAFADAGDGAGTWKARVVQQNPGGGARLDAPASVEVPGSLLLTVSADRRAREGERTGFVVLSRDGETLRIPFWFRVTNPSLALQKAKSLPGPGTYNSTTAGRPAVVSRYRYPDRSPAFDRQELNGPERVFQLRIGKAVRNFGVAVIGQKSRVDVEPRIVRGRDENRLAGETALPFVTNAYLSTFGDILPVAGALRPLPGEYAIVFDSENRRASGHFLFRLWVDDVTPPRITLLSRSGTRLTAKITDPNGSGVYAESIEYAIDDRHLVSAQYEPKTSTATIDLSDVRPGRHRLVIKASDLQETKNTENAGGILPNTRTFTASVTVP